MNRFSTASIQWERDVDELAAELLTSGAARTPLEARAMARDRVQQRRVAARMGNPQGASTDALAKVFSGLDDDPLLKGQA